LRSRKYREADCLLTLLTRSRGKVGAIAKGVRKAKSSLRGGVQAFTYNEMLLYKGRSLDTVTQSQTLEAFIPLQEDIRGLTAAAYWSELLDVLIPEGEKDDQVFNTALAGFHLLALSPNVLSVRGLEVKLLSLLGYRPCLDKCVSCQSSLNSRNLNCFSVRLGGVLCPACGSKEEAGGLLPFSPEALQAWLQLQRMEFSKFQRLKISSQGLRILDKVIENYLLMQLDYPLKSRPLLKEILSYNG
jgi:DNA repair protein RecO (recombination protein O)